MRTSVMISNFSWPGPIDDELAQLAATVEALDVLARAIPDITDIPAAAPAYAGRHDHQEI